MIDRYVSNKIIHYANTRNSNLEGIYRFAALKFRTPTLLLPLVVELAYIFTTVLFINKDSGTSCTTHFVIHLGLCLPVPFLT